MQQLYNLQRESRYFWANPDVHNVSAKNNQGLLWVHDEADVDDRGLTFMDPASQSNRTQQHPAWRHLVWEEADENGGLEGWADSSLRRWC
jgi:hypothetical protein